MSGAAVKSVAKAAGVSGLCYRGKLAIVVAVGVAAFGLAWYFTSRSEDDCKTRRCRKGHKKHRKNKKCVSFLES